VNNRSLDGFTPRVLNGGQPCGHISGPGDHHNPFGGDAQILSVPLEGEGQRVKVFAGVAGGGFCRYCSESMCGRCLRPTLRLRRRLHERTAKAVKDYENRKWLLTD